MWLCALTDISEEKLTETHPLLYLLSPMGMVTL